MSRFFRKIVVLLLLAGIFQPAASPCLFAAERLTLEQALAIARRKNPSLAASEKEVEASRARRVQANSSYYPQVDASAGYDYTWDDPDQSPVGTGEARDSYSTGLSVTQYLYDFGKTPARVESSTQSLNSSLYNLQGIENTLVMDVKAAYFDVLRQQELVKVRKEALEASGGHLTQARALYAEGMRPRIDMTRVEVEVSQAELSLVRARYALQRSISALERLLGGPPAAGEYALEEPGDAPDGPAAMEPLIELALKHRPELKDLRARIRGAEAELLSIRRSALPSLNAGGSYRYSGEVFPLDRRWQVGMALSWPLFTGFRQSGQVSESSAEVGRLNALLDASVLSVMEEVTQAFLQVREAEEAIKAAETALKQARENLEMAEGRYKAGVGDAIELSDAQVLYTESRSALVQAVYDRQTAFAALEYAVGGFMK